MDQNRAVYRIFGTRLQTKQKHHFNLYPFEMADENEKLLMELMRKNENSICADCRRKGK